MLSLNCRNGGKKGAAVSYHDETEIGINGGEKGVTVNYLKSPRQGINKREEGRGYRANCRSRRKRRDAVSWQRCPKMPEMRV